MTMHESFFHFYVSRPYPFKWFTPVVVVGGVIAVVLFSFLNVATSGYELTPTTSANPNATIASKRTWFNDFPSYMAGNMKAQCELATIPLNTKLFTNNTALAYTLTNAWQEDESGKQKNAGSLMLMNNRLRDCEMDLIDIQLEGLDRSASQVAKQKWGAEVRGYIKCQMMRPSGPTYVNLTAEYDLLPNTPYQPFAGRDKENLTSLYWGESLLSLYHSQLTVKMGKSVDRQKNKWYKVMTKFERQNNVTDIDSLDFYKLHCWLIQHSDDGDRGTVTVCKNTIAELSGEADFIWISADTLAKTFYSTVMTDLGQMDGPGAKSNILTDPKLLQHFSANLSDIVNMPTGNGNNVRVDPDLEQAQYDPDNDSPAYPGNLAVNASTLAADYICQVPRPKSTGTLILSVLIANLVFLQALWRLFKLCVDSFLLQRHPQLNQCESCGHSKSLSVSDEEQHEQEYDQQDQQPAAASLTPGANSGLTSRSSMQERQPYSPINQTGP